MTIQAWPLQPDDPIGIAELADACAMSCAELEELVEYGALVPLSPLCDEPAFAVEWLQPLRIACKLRRDYDLDLFVVVIVMDYLHRIEILEAGLRGLEARLGV